MAEVRECFAAAGRLCAAPRGDTGLLHVLPCLPPLCCLLLGAMRRHHPYPLLQALQQQLDAAGDNVQALKAVVTAAGSSDAGAPQLPCHAMEACCGWASILYTLLVAVCSAAAAAPPVAFNQTPMAAHHRCAESLKVKDAALGRLTDLLVKAGDAPALRSLLTDLRPLFAAM